MAAPRHMAKKKSFRSAPRIVSGRDSDRCTLLIRLVSAMCFSFGTCVIQLPGKSHDRKFTAAMAMPTPKSTPASTRFEPPSPKAKVRPATTMATSERPRAMVLVKACLQHANGVFPWGSSLSEGRSGEEKCETKSDER